MPPHKTYVEACMGSAEVFLRKRPVEREIINDFNGDLVRFFRVLQRNENLQKLIGRLYLSFNSEQIFRANKALLAEVPNILDDITETSVIIENTPVEEFELAMEDDREDMVADNDAYHALKAVGGLIFTGPTGTNVNDVAIALLG